MMSTLTEKIVELKDFPKEPKQLDFVKFKEFLIIIIAENLWVYETI